MFFNEFNISISEFKSILLKIDLIRMNLVQIVPDEDAKIDEDKALIKGKGLHINDNQNESVRKSENLQVDFVSINFRLLSCL